MLRLKIPSDMVGIWFKRRLCDTFAPDDFQKRDSRYENSFITYRGCSCQVLANSRILETQMKKVDGAPGANRIQ